MQCWCLARVRLRGDNGSMFSAKQLTDDQKTSLHTWAAEGATMSDLQRRMKEDLGINITYMDTRFLVLDLGIELIEEEKPAEKVVEPESAPVPTGKVSVSADTLALPGALISGRVSFSDGETGIWMIDESGRPGLDANTPGYRPSQEDLVEFQHQLRAIIQEQGL